LKAAGDLWGPGITGIIGPGGVVAQAASSSSDDPARILAWTRFMDLNFLCSK
jgi:hypothetical protein